jgi:hypothetical protein
VNVVHPVVYAVSGHQVLFTNAFGVSHRVAPFVGVLGSVLRQRACCREA